MFISIYITTSAIAKHIPEKSGILGPNCRGWIGCPYGNILSQNTQTILVVFCPGDFTSDLSGMDWVPVLGTFCHKNVSSPGCFVPGTLRPICRGMDWASVWEHFATKTLRPWGCFVLGTLRPWDILSLGRLVQGCNIQGRL
jgi:hypothetical protein